MRALSLHGTERFAQLDSGQLTLAHGALIGAPASAQGVAFLSPSAAQRMGHVDLRWVRRNAEAHGLPHAEP